MGLVLLLRNGVGMGADVFQSLQHRLGSGWRRGQMVAHRPVAVLVGGVGHHIGLAIVAHKRVLSMDSFTVLLGIYGLQDTILSGLGAVAEFIAEILIGDIVR